MMHHHAFINSDVELPFLSSLLLSITPHLLISQTSQLTHLTLLKALNWAAHGLLDATVISNRGFISVPVKEYSII